MKDLITIVVPVYNTKNYLGKCLDSLICQTYDNLRIICVDDGSRDGSKDVINEYVSKDNRIEYIYQENGGAASARNIGIDMFMKDDSSNYIIFVDSDDYVEKDFVETLYDTLIKYDADVATCDMCLENESFKSDRETQAYNRKEVLKLYFKDKIFRETPVCKIYKKKMFNELRFPNGMHYEDTFETYKFIEILDKVSHINYYSYKVVIRNDSLTHSEYSDYEYDKAIAGLEIYNYYKGTEFEKLAYNKYLGILFYFIIKTNRNKDKITKNKIALKEVKDIVNKNGFKDARLIFYPFILLTKFGLIDKVSI